MINFIWTYRENSLKINVGHKTSFWTPARFHFRTKKLFLSSYCPMCQYRPFFFAKSPLVACFKLVFGHKRLKLWIWSNAIFSWLAITCSDKGTVILSSAFSPYLELFCSNIFEVKLIPASDSLSGTLVQSMISIKMRKIALVNEHYFILTISNNLTFFLWASKLAV